MGIVDIYNKPQSETQNADMKRTHEIDNWFLEIKQNNLIT